MEVCHARPAASVTWHLGCCLSRWNCEAPGKQMTISRAYQNVLCRCSSCFYLVPSISNWTPTQGCSIEQDNRASLSHTLTRKFRQTVAEASTFTLDLDKMMKLFDFHESGSVLVVHHEAKLEHVRHAKTAKRANCLHKLSASCPTQKVGEQYQGRTAVVKCKQVTAVCHERKEGSSNGNRGQNAVLAETTTIACFKNNHLSIAS